MAVMHKGVTKMKRNTIKSIFIIFTILFFASCEVGLGPSVDMEGPVVTLDSHSDNDSVAQIFRLAGTAKDNVDVTKITIDFEDADIHFRVTTGNECRWQKKTSSTDWVDTEGYCVREKEVWNWYVDVNASDAKAGTGTNFIFTVAAHDARGNSSKQSKIDCAVIVDEAIPVVSVFKPDLTPTYTDAKNNYDSFTSIDGNNFSQLLNGNLELYGRQEGSYSFTELLVEFDNGISMETKTSGTCPIIKDVDTAKIANDYPINDVAQGDTYKKYYSKTLKRGENGVVDLRNWQLSINANEWVNDSFSELKTGKHLIRVVTTSISSSAAWERKVLGFFIWWPEADEPWVTPNNGSTTDDESSITEIFPSSSISGMAYDDDGIKSLSYTLKKKNDTGYDVFEGKQNVLLSLSEENAKTTQWSILSPSQNGIYEVCVTVVDLNGKTISQTRYFKTMDVKAPKIHLDTIPAALTNRDGNITFSGTVVDDGTVKSLRLIYLNPNYNSDSENLIRYMGGKESFWEPPADSTIYDNVSDKDSTGKDNIIYTINFNNSNNPAYDSATKEYTYSFSRTFNLFTDFGIGNEDITKTKPLESLNFVLRAIDNGGTTSVISTSVSGDMEAPKLEIVSIQQFDKDDKPRGTEQKFIKEDGQDNIPDFLRRKEGDYAILKGTLSDNSITAWKSNSNNVEDLIYPISFKWGNLTADSFAITEIKASSGISNQWEWTAKAGSIPQTTQTLELSLTDYGINTTSITKSVIIESEDLEIESVRSDDIDGVYRVGKALDIILEFTKNVKVTGNPRLQLKIGNDETKYATFVSSSDESAQIHFTYPIESTDDSNGENIDVIGIDWDENNYFSDKNVPDSDFEPVLPTERLKKLGTGRNIKIDNTKPQISSIECISAADSTKNYYYSVGSTILFRMNFTENVSFENEDNLELTFAEILTPTVEPQQSGSCIVFKYVVSGSENALEGLTPVLASPAESDDIQIKDVAGNILTDWTIPDVIFDNVIVDTTPPSEPVINAAWGNAKIITSAAGTSFTLNDPDDEDCNLEYSLDNGASWFPYVVAENSTEATTIELKNNGTYKILARQTDLAGNTTTTPTPKIVTVEKGDFLSYITADNINGTYSAKTTINSITGRIVFRRDVTIVGDNPYVTLNVRKNNEAGVAQDFRTCELSKVSNKPEYTFTYNIQDGDYIDNNADGVPDVGFTLDVNSWSFNKVKFDPGVTGVNPIEMDMSFVSSVTDGKHLNQNKQIKLQTGKITIDSSGATLSNDNSKITIKFNRNVSKVASAGYITLTIPEESFRVPVVLSESDYSALPSELKAYYKPGVNGAELVDPDSTTNYKLKNDNTPKYILEYKYDDIPGENDAESQAVKDAFISSENKKNVLSIPLYSSAVSMTNDTMTINLTGVYALPVKGTNYTLVLPQGAVKDSVENTNDDYTKTIISNGIEAPVIRIDRSAYTINGAGNTLTATVTMPSKANLKISCRTPGADIYYETKAEKTNVQKVNRSRDNADYSGTIKTNAEASDPNAVLVPDHTKNENKYSTPVELGADITGYDNASGMKFAISAKARKNGKDSKTSFEYATRTVLKFEVTGSIQGNGNEQTEGIVENGTKLTFKDLKVWVIGGDAPYGGNTSSSTPLSWGDPSNFKIMAGGPFESNNMHGKWYWVSWDVTDILYHGFVIGDVPSGAQTEGPSEWYAGECAWAADKMYYPLYPGETLQMTLENGNNSYYHSTYLFRIKNKGTR